MKRITKIRIPKGKYCEKKCIAYDSPLYCRLFEEYLDMDYKTVWNYFRCRNCLKMFPDGAVFELKEKK